MNMIVNKVKIGMLNSSFNKAISNTRDFKNPLSKSANLIVEDATRNFDDQGYTYGRAWTPLKPATARQRGSYRPILYRTGTLKRGTKVKSVSKEKATVHNPVTYAPYHQFGTRHMPQRIILDVSNKAIRAIKIIFENYVRDNITRPFSK
jgi:phage gpG-like protein